MSITMYVARGPESAMRTLSDDPDRLAGLAMGGGPGAAEANAVNDVLAAIDEMGGGQNSLVAKGARYLIERIEAIAAAERQSATASGDAVAVQSDETPVVDLHKSWHIIYYLLLQDPNGSAAADILLDGGDEAGGDLGYGPARLVEASTTSRLASLLETTTVADLNDRIDAAAMADAGLYTVAGGAESAAEMVADVEHYYPKLRDHVVAAAGQGDSLLIWLM